jgi:nitrite reductase/ring-hydroxylating ferredoxin subunit
METQQPASGADPTDSARAPFGRRRFLAVCGKSAAALASLGIIVAALRFIYPPSRRWLRWPRIVAPFQTIAAIDTLPLGEWKLLPIASVDDEIPPKKRSVWVLRDGDNADAFRVLSGTCTHAGCQVAWKNARKLFVCPCHGGTFDADGNRKSGPPQRALAAVDYQVKDGQLLVRSDDV